MKILIVHNQLWAHYKAVVFNELHRISADWQAEILVVHLAEVEKSRTSLGKLNRDFHQYPYQVLHEGTLEDFGFLAKSWRLFSVFWQYRPDVLNLTGYYDPATWLLILCSKLLGIKVVMSNESTASDQRRNVWKERLKHIIVKSCDAFFCFGSRASAYMQALGANPKDILVKNAAVVDNDSIRNKYLAALPNRAKELTALSAPTKNFIFVGRLVEVKNLFKCLEAFGLAVKPLSTEQRWGFLLIGEGELREVLEVYTQDKHIPNVHFLGGKSSEQIPAALTLGDVLVLSSTSETWGLVVNEAMACGLPVLVSERCGCATDLVVNSENGFVFDPENVDELATLMTQFMANTYDLTTFGHRSTQLVQRFSPSAAAKEMMQGFRQLVG